MCFRKCLQEKNILNVIVFDVNGIPKQSTINQADTIRHVGLLDELIVKSKRAIQTINHLDDFSSMRIHSRKFEIIITKDVDLFFVVFQNSIGTVILLTRRK